MKNYTRILSIAGSDSGGGAGIQADIKSISANGGFATTAITAITAQNTRGVSSIFPIPVSTLEAQLDAVLNDIGADAAKIGMLHSAEVIATVTKALNKFKVKNIVVDPVMVATSGDRLLQDEAIQTLMDNLLPKARLITPNIPEAELLLGKKINLTNLVKNAELLAHKFKVSVLLKGGHLTTDILKDVLYNYEDEKFYVYENPKIKTKNTHGTGCTLSASISTYLGKGYQLNQAVEKSISYLQKAINEGANYELGQGNAPVHHFHQWY